MEGRWGKGEQEVFYSNGCKNESLSTALWDEQLGAAFPEQTREGLNVQVVPGSPSNSSELPLLPRPLPWPLHLPRVSSRMNLRGFSHSEAASSAETQGTNPEFQPNCHCCVPAAPLLRASPCARAGLCWGWVGV